ncbi:MAG TPA: DUF4214 domain-containing protein, partial [Pyrinomonadaceae bacterium]
ASTFDGGTATLQISGAAARTITLPAGGGIPRLTVNAPNVTLNTSGAPGSVSFPQSVNLQSATAIGNGAVSFTFGGTFTLSTNFTQGTGDLTFNGAYTQTAGTFTSGSGVLNFNSSYTLNGGTFNAAAGLLTFVVDVTVADPGVFNPNGGTVVFAGNQTVLNLPATFTLNNVTVNKNHNQSLLFNTTSTIVAAGTLTLNDGLISSNAGTGTMGPQGPVIINSTFDGGTARITFLGSADQTFINNGGVNPTGPWTVNKTSGTVTLLSDLLLGATQALNITSGTLHQGTSGSITCGPVNVGVAGQWLNFGTGDVTNSGGVVNNGTIGFNSGGSFCGDPDDIAITSPLPGNAWSGSGTFMLTDVTVSNQAGTAPITVLSGTNAGNNGANWTISSDCGGPSATDGVISGRITGTNGQPIEGAVIRLNGTQTRKTITDSNGTYQFAGVETGGIYTVQPARANYLFTPANRSFSQIGERTEAVFSGAFTGDVLNPLDTPEYFVRQQYVDILGREPDESGFNYWSDRILDCADDSPCMRSRRVDVAAAFFIEREFQQTGSFIYGLYATGLARQPAYSEFSFDRQQVLAGDALETRKQALALAFVQRPEFVRIHQADTTADSFVSALLQTVQQTIGVDLSTERVGLIDRYNTGLTLAQSRSSVMVALLENENLQGAQRNRAFVLTEYFGYLRRDPDAGGYAFWLDALNNRESGNYRAMVCAFITSAEYQQRFSVIVNRSNSECGN